MKNLISIFTATLLVAGLLVAGCSTVGVKTTMGPPEQVFNPAEFEGDWQLSTTEGDDTQTYNVKRLQDGTLRFATLEWDIIRGEHVVVNTDAQFMLIADEPFLQLKSEEPDSLYYFYRITQVGEGEIIIHPPSIEPFAQAVASGILEGTVDSSREDGTPNSVELAHGPQLRDYLDNAPASSLFPAGSTWEMRARRTNQTTPTFQ